MPVEHSKGRGRATKRPPATLSATPAAEATVPVARKNPIHSVLTTLPVIMLLAGLGFYFNGEKKQREGVPVLEQMVVLSGDYSGLTQQGSRPSAQRILWLQVGDKTRGGRVTLAQYKKLQVLEKGQALQLWLAPKVRDSDTLWLLKAVSQEQIIVDQLQAKHN